MKKINGMKVDEQFSEKQYKEIVKLVVNGYLPNIEEVRKYNHTYYVYVGDMNDKDAKSYLQRISKEYSKSLNLTDDNAKFEPVRKPNNNINFPSAKNVFLSNFYDKVKAETNIKGKTILHLKVDDKNDTILYPSNDATQLDLYFGYFNMFMVKCVFNEPEKHYEDSYRETLGSPTAPDDNLHVDINERYDIIENDVGGKLISYDELCKKLPDFGAWLNVTIRDFNYVQCFELEDIYKAYLFTEENEYKIIVRKDKNYMGAFQDCRKYEAGETWTRGSDLPDGEYSESTFGFIMAAIIRHELVKISDEGNINKKNK